MIIGFATGSADAGYAAMQQLWYNSLFPTKSAYQVASGGQCNPSAAVNGCGATNWYTVLLAVDDDDGGPGILAIAGADVHQKVAQDAFKNVLGECWCRHNG